MFSNVTLYIFGGLLVLLLGFAVYAKIDALQLDACRAKSALYVHEIQQQNAKIKDLQTKELALMYANGKLIAETEAKEAQVVPKYAKMPVPKDCEGAVGWLRAQSPSLGSW